MEAFLKFIAANALLSNLDSYLGFGHNYYLYLIPRSNKFVFIPWDLDLSLATWPAVGTPEQLVQLSIRHPHSGEVAAVGYTELLSQLRAAWLTPKFLPRPIRDLFIGRARLTSIECRVLEAFVIEELHKRKHISGIPPPVTEQPPLAPELNHAA